MHYSEITHRPVSLLGTYMNTIIYLCMNYIVGSGLLYDPDTGLLVLYDTGRILVLVYNTSSLEFLICNLESINIFYQYSTILVEYWKILVF